MFVKHGDNTESLSIEKIADTCEVCLSPILKINGKLSCSCSDDKSFSKINKILTQNIKPTNLNETR